MNNIQLKGTELLTESERGELDSLITKYSEKIKWKTKSDFILKIAIKVHNKNPENKDKRRHYGIHIELSGETSAFEAIGEDWDFNIAVKKTFEKLEQEIEHKFHSSEQRSKKIK